MKESTKAKSQRILDVLLTGRKITPYEANMIANTTDGTRYIRFLREKYPIKDEKVENELYHRYWIDDEFLYEWWKSKGEEVQTNTEEVCYYPDYEK